MTDSPGVQAGNVATVLIVEDEDLLRNAIAFIFKRRRFTILEARNGKEAFDIVTTNQVDVILTDVRMPGGDGIELLDRVKAIHPTLPIVMFITEFSDMSHEEAYNRGADAVFSKPFDQKNLFEAVLKIIGDRESVWNSRKSERLPCEFNFHLQLPGIGTAIEGRILNIGRGGVFVKLEGPLPSVGTLVSFDIHFESGTLSSISGTGIVRWIRKDHTPSMPSGFGVEFETLSDTSRQQVIELIQSMNTKVFIPSS